MSDSPISAQEAFAISDARRIAKMPYMSTLFTMIKEASDRGELEVQVDLNNQFWSPLKDQKGYLEKLGYYVSFYTEWRRGESDNEMIISWDLA